jgi:hypothetical protein
MEGRGALEIGLLVVAIGLAAIGALLSLAALMVHRRVRRVLGGTRGVPGSEVLVALRDHEEDLDALDGALVDVQARLADVERDLALCTSRVAMAHYDAFPDMGGKLSFSVAMLDEQGDGIVLSVINGRSETRAWGKRVVAGRSRQRLSDEEARVVDRALAFERLRDDGPVGDPR